MVKLTGSTDFAPKVHKEVSNSMSTISQIRSSLVSSAESSSKSSASGGSTISGKGVSASFDSVNITGQLDSLRGAFQRSAVRLSDGLSQFEVTANRLESLLGITQDLLALAEDSADVTGSAEDRAANNRRFQKLVGEFEDIVDESVKDGFDPLDKNELANALRGTGADLDQVTAVSTLFDAVAGSDNVVGFANIVSETLTSPVPIAVIPEVQFVAGTFVAEKTSNESGTGGSGSGITFGQVLKDSTASSQQFIIGTSGDYGGLNSGNLEGAATIGTSEVGALDFDANPTEDVRVLDVATNGQTIAIVGTGTNSQVILAGSTTLVAVQDEIDTINETTQASSVDASLSANGTGFVYVDPSGTLQHGLTADYELSGSSSLTAISGSVNTGVDTSNSGFVFTSSDATLGANGTDNSLFYVDDFAAGGTVTQIDDPSGGSIEADSIAISDDGNFIAYANDSGELFLYSVIDQASTKIGVSTSAFSQLDLNDDGSILAVIEDHSTYDDVSLYDVSTPSTPTLVARHSFVDEGDIKVKELSLNSAGDAFSYVIDEGLDGIDEVIFGFVDNSSALDDNFTVNGTSFRVNRDGATFFRISETTESGGSTIYNNTVVQNASNTVYFDTDANYGNGTSRQATSGRDGIGILGQFDNADNDSRVYATDDSGTVIFVADELDGGDIQLSLYNTSTNQNTTAIEYISNFSADTFKAAVSGDGSNYIYFGEQSETITSFTTNSERVNLSDGEIQGALAGGSDYAAFYSNTAEFGGDGSGFDLFFTDYNGGSSPLQIDLGDAGVSDNGVNTSTLSLTETGSHAVFATNDGELFAASSEEANAYQLTLDNFTGTVTDVAVNAAGDEIAVLVEQDGVALLQVYSGDIMNQGSTLSLEYQHTLGTAGVETFSNLAISNDGSVVSYISDQGDQALNDLFTATKDQAPTPYSARETVVEAPVEVSGGNDPLNQDISTIGGALIAKKALTQLSEDIERDLGAIEGIVKELRSSLAFALQGARSSNELLNSQLVSGPEQAAEKIRQDILSNPAGFQLSHGNLDTILQKDLDLL